MKNANACRKSKEIHPNAKILTNAAHLVLHQLAKKINSL